MCAAGRRAYVSPKNGNYVVRQSGCAVAPSHASLSRTASESLVRQKPSLSPTKRCRAPGRDPTSGNRNRTSIGVRSSPNCFFGVLLAITTAPKSMDTQCVEHVHPSRHAKLMLPSPGCEAFRVWRWFVMAYAVTLERMAWPSASHAIDAAPMTRPMPHAACGVNQSSFVDHITVGCGKIQHASDRERVVRGPELRVWRRGAARGHLACDGRGGRATRRARGRGGTMRAMAAPPAAAPGKRPNGPTVESLYNLVRVSLYPMGTILRCEPTTITGTPPASAASPGSAGLEV